MSSYNTRNKKREKDGVLSLINFFLHFKHTFAFCFKDTRKIKTLIAIVIFICCTDGGYRFISFFNNIYLYFFDPIFHKNSIFNFVNNFTQLFIYDKDKRDFGLDYISYLITGDQFSFQEYGNKFGLGLYLFVKIIAFLTLLYSLVRSFDEVLILVGNRHFDKNDDFAARGVTVGRSVDEISAVYLLLALYVHCLLECTLGYGTGSSWASDYIVVIVAAWIFRSAPVWSDLAISRTRDNVQDKARKLAAEKIANSLAIDVSENVSRAGGR